MFKRTTATVLAFILLVENMKRNNIQIRQFGENLSYIYFMENIYNY